MWNTKTMFCLGRHRFIVALAFTLVAIRVEGASPFYVHSARLVIRDEPTTDSSVKGQVPTNTRIWIKSRVGDWCQITVEPTSDGYAECRFLAERKVRLVDIDKQLSLSGLTNQARLELLQQKFWVSPSPENLLAYGAALDEVYPLPYSERSEYEPPARPIRPEYEAMKQFMRDGWSPAEFEYPQPKRGLTEAKTAVYSLPPVRPSLFLERPPHLILGPYFGKRYENYIHRETAFMVNTREILREVLWRNSVQTLSMTSITGPLAGHYGGFYGDWDVGGFSLQLGPPALPVAALTERGGSLSSSIVRVSTEKVNIDAECDQIGETLTLSEPVFHKDAVEGILAFVADPKTVGMTSSRRMAWETKVLTAEEAGLAHRVITGVDVDPAALSLRGYRAFIITFDLNNDGIADLAFEGIEGGIGSNYLSTGPKIDRVFAAFVNMNGKWMKYSTFSPLRCST